jgi:CarD family transcriptional regulator
VTFQVGDKVIYPNHGLGIVERIEEKTILGTTCGFFHLRIVANDTTVLVPVANVDGVGLRKAIDDAEVERLFTLIGDGKIDNHQNWKGRFKDNSDKMRTGSIYDMADVLKSLTFLSKSKSLSFREKRMLDRAKALIISEVSEVMRLKALEVEEQVDRALEKCFTTKVRNINRTQARTKTAAKPAAAMAVPAKPAVATVAKPVVAAPAKPIVAAAPAKPAVNGSKPLVANGTANGTKAIVANGAAKPLVANGVAKPVVAAKSVMAKPVKAAVPPLVAGRRTAARAS